MKGNQSGFTLVGVLILAGILAAIIGGGFVYHSYQAKRIAAQERSAQADQLKNQISRSSGAAEAVNQSGQLQFESLEKAAEAPSGNDSNTGSYEVNSKDNHGCAYPCHFDQGSCIINKYTYCQLGYRPSQLPSGCSHSDQGGPAPFVNNNTAQQCRDTAGPFGSTSGGGSSSGGSGGSTSGGGSSGGSSPTPTPSYCHFEPGFGMIITHADCCSIGFCPTPDPGCNFVPNGPAGPYATNVAPLYCKTNFPATATPSPSPIQGGGSSGGAPGGGQ